MPRYGMVIDTDRCSGCQNCVVACTQENNLAPGTEEQGEMGRLLRWLNILPQIEGEYPHVEATLEPLMCQHCDRPPCTFVCPVSATYLSPDGSVAQIYWRCIGCRFCVNACPYTAKNFNWEDPAIHGDLRQAVNPDVSVRTAGVTEKCSFCHHRKQTASEADAAKGSNADGSHFDVACAESCPSQAIIFGDLDDENSPVVEAGSSNRKYHLLEEVGTKPKITFLKRRD